jgi:hypothetical protein
MRSPIFKYYSQKDLSDSENLNVYVELHHLGTAPSQYEEYPIYKKTFEIVATAYDRKGKEYVAIIVGKEYPIYAVQFHPEIVSANRRNSMLILIPSLLLWLSIWLGLLLIFAAKAMFWLLKAGFPTKLV